MSHKKPRQLRQTPGLKETTSPGVLYVVATPIGNLEDLSARAVAVLQGADLVLAEDTRKFAVLAQRFAIHAPCRSYHDHNERTRSVEVLELLKDGRVVALTTEAGTPTISDPGYRLIHACHEQGLGVRTVPGPCAAIAALSISGFPTHSFCFQGFLPQKPGKKTAAIKEAVERNITTVFYESPYRILKTLDLIASLYPQLSVFIGRELTKVHEETLLGPAGEVAKTLRLRKSIKGEIVLIVGSPAAS
jgi:16S rRNA (cytidine1402-2'-O)-methyltransferase